MQLALNLPNSLAAAQSLFRDANGHPITTSRAVAERFGKRHKNVLQAIEFLIADSSDSAFIELNFQPNSYTDSINRTLPEYRLTKDGFALLAMGFTGADALAWKIAFIKAFNAMEADLIARVEREANALHRLRPHWRAIVVGTQAGLSRRQICAYAGLTSPTTITANRRRLRAVGLLAA